jgi:hypothetical protein
MTAVWPDVSGATHEELYWEVLSVEANIEDSADRRTAVRFTNGQTYTIPLNGGRPIAVLLGLDSTSFLLATGTGCRKCDENASLYLFELGGPKLFHTGRRYSYPGEYIDYLEPYALIRSTRTFYGSCLMEQADVVLWFSEYLGDDGAWQQSNSVVRLSAEGDTLTELGSSTSLSAVIDRADSELCFELPGVAASIDALMYGRLVRCNLTLRCTCTSADVTVLAFATTAP